MNAKHVTALGTTPFHFFILNEMSDPEFIYHFEIVDHAHAILSVSLVQLFQPWMVFVVFRFFSVIAGYSKFFCLTISFIVMFG